MLDVKSGLSGSAHSSEVAELRDRETNDDCQGIETQHQNPCGHQRRRANKPEHGADVEFGHSPVWADATQVGATRQSLGTDEGVQKGDTATETCCRRQEPALAESVGDRRHQDKAPLY